MAIVEDVPDDAILEAEQVLRQRIPLTHPSAVRGENGKTQPLVSIDPTDPTDPADPPDEVTAEPVEFWDEFFDSLILTVPFTFLYVLLNILVHLQYQHRPTLPELAEDLSKAVPTLGILVFYTTRHANHPLTNMFLMSASIISGARLIWIVNKAGWALTTAQAPPMGTLWILTIVQLPLSRAVISLAGVAGWVWYSGMKVSP